MITDTSVWIEHFAGRESESVSELRRALYAEVVTVPDLVVFEVLRGFRYDKDLQVARATFAKLQHVMLGGLSHSRLAAERYRSLRQRGITVHSSIDALLASYCIDEDIPLLFDDRDFLPYVEHFGLRRVV